MKPARIAPALVALGCALLAAAPPELPPAVAAEGARARAALLTVPADLPAEKLGEAVSARLTVRARVSAAGLVDSARASGADPLLRAAAEDAVRWWVFEPSAAASWVQVEVAIDAPADSPGLHPDVLAMARDAEARGDLPTALAAWTGALKRAGTSPVVNNDWRLRERAIAVARRMPSPPPPGDVVGGDARSARGRQQRALARGAHADLVADFDKALLATPWWDEAWLWRAGSLAGCGRAAEALRSLRAYRLASPDSAGLAFAAGLVERLAAADTLGVSEAIKTWRVAPASPPR